MRPSVRLIPAALLCACATVLPTPPPAAPSGKLPPRAELALGPEALVADLLRELRTLAARLLPSPGECYLVLGAAVEEGVALSLRVGERTASAALGCERRPVFRAVANRGVFLREFWTEPGTLKVAARALHFGAPGKAFLNAPVGGLGLQAPAAVVLGLQLTGDEVVVVAIPAPSGPSTPPSSSSQSSASSPSSATLPSAEDHHREWERVTSGLTEPGLGLYGCAHDQPSPRGEATVDFTVDGEGRVCELELVASTLRDEATERCVVEHLRGIQFAATGRFVRASFPLEFEPPRRAAPLEDPVISAIRSRRGEVTRCYLAPAESRAAAGRLVVKIAIAPDGAVTGVERHGGSTLDSKELVECVAGVVKGWKLPADAQPREVFYTFRFGAADRE